MEQGALVFEVVFDIAFPRVGARAMGRCGSDLCPLCAVVRLCEQIRSGCCSHYSETLVAKERHNGELIG